MINSSSKTKPILNTETIKLFHLRIGRSKAVWLGAVLTVAVMTLLINLGMWQLQRAEFKRDLELQLELREVAASMPITELSDKRFANYTGLRVHGQLTPVANHYLLLDNQTYNGKVGYLAYQLMRAENGENLLFEMGFISALSSRQWLPKVDWLRFEDNFEGRLYQRTVNPLSSSLELEPGAVGRIQNLNFDELEKRWGLRIKPYMFQPQSEDWPYPQPWQPIALGSERHFGYAIQWFGLAFALLCLSLWAWIGYVVRKKDD